MPIVLAIESSCDETAAAVVQDGRVRSSIVASQIETHARFGGVVPELASRQHLGAIVPVVTEALQQAGLHRIADVDAIAVTEGPGLAGALLVGLQAARGLALAGGKPLHGVHHMEGHIFSVFLGDEVREPTPFVPHIALLVSGGHTEIVRASEVGAYEILGATRDDAAGEAYDKVAKLLGLGYPGGPIVDRLAAEGSPSVSFPRAMAHQDNLDFSFAGLKTAVLVHLERGGEPTSRAELVDLCASFQAAVVDVLVLKVRRAVQQTGLNRLHIVGGVAANKGLRAAAQAAAIDDGFELRAAPLRYCGDNAAMIAAAAEARITLACPPGATLHTSRPLDDARMRVR